MEQQLWLGTDKTDITPPWSVPLAGFSVRNELGGFESVALPIHARIFRLGHSDGRGETTEAVIVSADLLWWGEDRVPGLKARIGERWGIAPDAILLHGTHSHSGPMASRLFSDYLGPAGPAYIEWLETAVLDGIERASANMEPVTASFGSGESLVSVNRRMMVDGASAYRANPEGPIDRALRVVRYRSARSGLDKGLLVHFACHPVITMENRISPEFCGMAMERIEQELGEGAVAAYLQGFCGDINPVGLDGELILQGDADEVERIGRTLAEDTLRVLSGELTPLEPCALEPVVLTVAAPLQKVPTTEELMALAGEPWVTGDWSRKLLASPELLRPEMPLRFVRLPLAEGLSLLAANAEIVAEYGLYLRELAAEHQELGLGYTNGMIGYIPTAEQIREGGYESFWSTPYFLLPSPYAPEVEQRVRSGLAELMREGDLT